MNNEHPDHPPIEGGYRGIGTEEQFLQMYDFFWSTSDNHGHTFVFAYSYAEAWNKVKALPYESGCEFKFEGSGTVSPVDVYDIITG
jgi:hypothetical protein